jgi:hypothetical protein
MLKPWLHLRKSGAKSQERIARNLLVLSVLVSFASLYIGWFAYFDALTSSARLDGSLGLLLGLYICSHPAANMLNMLLFMTAETREGITATRSGQFWLALNALTLLAGWVAIFSGAMRFVQRSF